MRAKLAGQWPPHRRGGAGRAAGQVGSRGGPSVTPHELWNGGRGRLLLQSPLLASYQPPNSFFSSLLVLLRILQLAFAVFHMHFYFRNKKVLFLTVVVLVCNLTQAPAADHRKLWSGRMLPRLEIGSVHVRWDGLRLCTRGRMCVCVYVWVRSQTANACVG